MNHVSAPRFQIGFTFNKRQTNKSVATIIDIWETYNSSGELVKVSYVTTHKFCGQTITEYDVADATIARGMCDLEKVDAVACAISIQLHRLNRPLTKSQAMYLYAKENNIPFSEITVQHFDTADLSGYQIISE